MTRAAATMVAMRTRLREALEARDGEAVAEVAEEALTVVCGLLEGEGLSERAINGIAGLRMLASEEEPSEEDIRAALDALDEVREEMDRRARERGLGVREAE